MQKIADYKQLMKLNLSLLVVFSSVVGYIIAPDSIVRPWPLFLLFIGGFLVTAAANATNEILEKNTDALMRRTKSRPIPDARMTILEASIFVSFALIVGLLILNTFNIKTTVLALISYLSYSFVYTPLKRISPISVLVGAIPGSLPCLIGWVAASNEFSSLAAWTLFVVQFFWQFPHFWAIAWLGHEDYEKAGMKMLPRSGKSGTYTAAQCTLYSAILIPLSALPLVVGIGGWISFTGMLLGAIWMVYNSILFLRSNSDANAKKVMFASFIYLPLVLLTLLLDKYI